MTTYLNKTKQFVFGVCLSVTASAALADGISWSTEGPSTPESGPGTEFGRSYLSFTTPLSQKSRANESLKSSFHFDMTEFRWTGVTAAQNDYYWISMPIEYRQQRGRAAQFIVRLEPGFMTDLNVIDSNSLTANVDLIGRFNQRGERFWQLGITVNREFGDLNPRPVVGMAFKATRDTEVLLGFPHTRIQTAWSESLSTYMRIAPEGGVWEEEIQTAAGTTDTYRTAYSNWKVGLGCDFHWQGPFWLNAEVGQLRHRRIWSTTSDGTAVQGTPAEDRYWQAGISLRY